MKAIYLNALKGMICNHFDPNIYYEITEKLGYSKDFTYLDNDDINPDIILSLCEELRRKLKLSAYDFHSLYGDYYISVYVKNHYNHFFTHASNIKDFLKRLNEIHINITKILGGGILPKIEIKEIGDVLHCKIDSKKNIHFVVSMIKALGKIYKERPTVELIDNDEILIKT
jgi:hypothetical protein